MATPLRGVHVAIVGEDREALEFLGQTLKYHGALVTAHESARSVLRVMQLLRVNVVIVDVRQVDGPSVELIEAVRRGAAADGARVPIVALYSGPADAEPRLVAADVDSVMKKPVQISELARTVAMVYAASSDSPPDEP